MIKIDYLIIGQGLAGSLLAWELIQRQQKVIVIDNNQVNASSVAAGLINPVTGMRFVKSTDVDQLLPTAIDFYQRLAQYFKQTFYVEKPMLRLIRNIKELSACEKRFKDKAYNPYLENIIPLHPDINSSLGLLKQNKTAYLLTVPLLAALKDYFISLDIYINTHFQYDSIKLSPVLQWKKFQPKGIIFCEGHFATKNPWFSSLPFQLVKGEIITATAKEKIQPSILNYGNWFIPLNERIFRTGATFDRDNINIHVTLSAKKQLLDSLKQVYPRLQIDQIINQQAGIRPTTLDKMPFVGQHPKHPELTIFNGFGSKGSLQIPWHCQRFADNLLIKKPLHSSSDIQRYHALF